jgi:hypothetical protein
MINAAVEKAMPIIDSKEIILMKFFFRLEKKYRLAIKRERFNGMLAKFSCLYSSVGSFGIFRFLIKSSIR